MPADNFFERLLLLPLFQGISRDEFLSIAEKARFRFHTCPKSHTIVKAGQPCMSLFFIISGETCFERKSDDYSYSLREWETSPSVLQAECLFGLATHYTHDVCSATEVQYFELDKADIRDMLSKYPTFRINFLNMLSFHIQQSKKLSWKPWPLDLPNRFVAFVASRSRRPAGHKELQIRMNILSDELGTTRLKVSKMLQDFASKNLVQLHRGRITIPAFEKLVQSMPNYLQK